MDGVTICQACIILLCFYGVCIQETAASAQESVDQIRLETKAMAEEQRLSLQAIEDSAAAARMKVGNQSSKVHKVSSSKGGNDVGPRPHINFLQNN